MKLAIAAAALTLALLGPAHATPVKPVRTSVLKATIMGCDTPTMSQHLIDLMHQGQDGDQRAEMQAHTIMFEGSSLGVCHFFSKQASVQLMVEDGGIGMSCITDGKNEPRQKVCYWVPTAWLP